MSGKTLFVILLLLSILVLVGLRGYFDSIGGVPPATDKSTGGNASAPAAARKVGKSTESSVILGRVIDPSGEAIESARVRLGSTGSPAGAVSGRDGSFELRYRTHAKSRPLEVVARHDTWGECRARADQETVILQYSERGTLNVSTVGNYGTPSSFYRSQGEPESVRNMLRLEGKSSEEGSAFTCAIGPGRYLVTVCDRDQQQTKLVELTQNGEIVRLDFEFGAEPQPIRLAGRMFLDSIPLVNRTVVCEAHRSRFPAGSERSRTRCRTDEHGDFSLETPTASPGAKLKFWGDGLYEVQAVVPGDPGEPLEVHFHTYPELTVAARDLDGRPMPKTKFRIKGKKGEYLSDSVGRVTIPSLEEPIVLQASIPTLTWEPRADGSPTRPTQTIEYEAVVGKSSEATKAIFPCRDGIAIEVLGLSTPGTALLALVGSPVRSEIVTHALFGQHGYISGGVSGLVGATVLVLPLGGKPRRPGLSHLIELGEREGDWLRIGEADRVPWVEVHIVDDTDRPAQGVWSHLSRVGSYGVDHRVAELVSRQFWKPDPVIGGRYLLADLKGNRIDLVSRAGFIASEDLLDLHVNQKARVLSRTGCIRGSVEPWEDRISPGSRLRIRMVVRERSYSSRIDEHGNFCIPASVADASQATYFLESGSASAMIEDAAWIGPGEVSLTIRAGVLRQLLRTGRNSGPR